MAARVRVGRGWVDCGLFLRIMKDLSGKYSRGETRLGVNADIRAPVIKGPPHSDRGRTSDPCTLRCRAAAHGRVRPAAIARALASGATCRAVEASGGRETRRRQQTGAFFMNFNMDVCYLTFVWTELVFNRKAKRCGWVRHLIFILTKSSLREKIK